MICKTLSENIKYFRKIKNLSQIQLADLANIHEKTVIRAESGKNEVTIEIIEKICNALEVEYYKVFIPRVSSSDNENNLRNIINAKLETLDLSRLKAVNNLIEDIKKIM